MKRQLKTVALISAMLFSTTLLAQESDEKESYDIETVFKGNSRSITGYGAITNKFTTIRGDYAHLAGLYGGVYLNHVFFIGIGGAALTNSIDVPLQFSTDPLRNMNYEYGQFGLVSEYVINSNKAFHVTFNLFSGAGFTLQADRYDWDDDRHGHDDFDFDDESHDTNWFFVAEPGVQLEINVFKWMRFSPGISYRAAFGSDGLGMKDSDISNISYNATLKFGRF